jgi:hypothetical protein
VVGQGERVRSHRQRVELLPDDDAVSALAVGVERCDPHLPHQTGGATNTASGSLNERLATNSFIWFAVPH